MSDSLRPPGLQHTGLPCPSPTHRACSNSCPSSQWCHPTISSLDEKYSQQLDSYLHFKSVKFVLFDIPIYSIRLKISFVLYILFKVSPNFSYKTSAVFFKTPINDKWSIFILHMCASWLVRGNIGDVGSIPGLGKSPEEGNDNPHQYSCLVNPMDRGARWAAVCVITSQMRLSD